MDKINIKDLNKNIPEYNDDDLLDLLNKSEVKESEPIKQNQILLEIKNKYGYADVFTLGNFSAFKGQAKSRKTFATTLFISECVYKENQNPFRCRKFGNVIYFDTEQSEYHVYKTIQRISGIKLNNYQSQNFYGFCLRPYMPDLRVKLIEKLLYSFNDITYVVIDGIRDLLFDINDQREAVIITTKLMKWTKELNIHISVVIHENKGDGKARGHIGTEIQNKCETVLKIEKDEDTTKIIPELMRGQDFDPISFQIQKTEKCFIPIIDESKMPF